VSKQVRAVASIVSGVSMESVIPRGRDHLQLFKRSW
jgi:hypothetical protein